MGWRQQPEKLKQARKEAGRAAESQPLPTEAGRRRATRLEGRMRNVKGAKAEVKRASDEI